MNILGMVVLSKHAASEIREFLKQLIEENRKLREAVEFHERQNAVRQRVANKIAEQREEIDRRFLKAIGVEFPGQ